MKVTHAARVASLVLGMCAASVSRAEPESAPPRVGRIAVERFFEHANVADVRVSPGGSYFAVERYTSEGVALGVAHRETETLARVAGVRGEGWLDYHWLEDDWIAVDTVQESGEHDLSLIRIEWNEDEKRVVPHAHSLPWRADVVHTLPRKPGKILLGGSRDVLVIDLAKLEKDGWEAVLQRSNRVATLGEPVVQWVVDRLGGVRAALVYESEGSRENERVFRRIYYRRSSDGLWRRGYRERVDGEVELRAFGITEDGERLIVSTNRDRDRNALVELDPETGKQVATIYAHPDAEIVDVVYDDDHQTMIAVGLLREGAREYHYFAEAFAEYEKALSAVVPDRTLRVTGVTRDRTVFGVIAFSPRHSARYYVVDMEARKALDIGPRSPGLEGVALAPRTRFVTRADGGPEIDAFFTVGANAPERPALVVVPHGGPIGPRTADSLDPFVQLLANRGYAVLEVDYRGSGDRGRAFERAGHRQWGKGIEDDIDAAVDYVLDKGWVDESRMAIVGGSYGGYSALMSAIRHPKQFRCVATLFGVTDLPLLYDLPAAQLNPWYRELRVKITGDPETEFDDMLMHSPVYRAAEFQIPILIMQGGSDDRVDVEHAYRLRLMLEKHGKEFEWLVMREKGHDLFPEPDTIRMMEKLVSFLAKHLGPNGPPAGEIARAN